MASSATKKCHAKGRASLITGWSSGLDRLFGRAACRLACRDAPILSLGYDAHTSGTGRSGFTPRSNGPKSTSVTRIAGLAGSTGLRDGVVAMTSRTPGTGCFVARVLGGDPRCGGAPSSATPFITCAPPSTWVVCELGARGTPSGPAVTEQRPRLPYPLGRQGFRIRSTIHKEKGSAGQSWVRPHQGYETVQGRERGALEPPPSGHLVDKHRLLLTAVTRHLCLGVRLQTEGRRRSLLRLGSDTAPVTGKRMVERKSLEDGAEIDRIPARFRPHVDVDPQFAFHVAFSESEVIVEGEAVVPSASSACGFCRGKPSRRSSRPVP